MLGIENRTNSYFKLFFVGKLANFEPKLAQVVSQTGLI